MYSAGNYKIRVTNSSSNVKKCHHIKGDAEGNETNNDWRKKIRIRMKPGVFNVIVTIAELKWKWSGYVARQKDYRWIHKIIQ